MDGESESEHVRLLRRIMQLESKMTEMHVPLPIWEHEPVAIDFDGVIFSYLSPWAGPGVLPDPPVPGAIQWLTRMVDAGFHVIIHSVRANWESGAAAILEWLRREGLEERVIEKLEIWHGPGKPYAALYIDDNAFRFEGFFPEPEEIRVMRGWTKTEAGKKRLQASMERATGE